MFALPDQKPQQVRLNNGQNVAQIIPVDVSINEPICDSVEASLEGPSFRTLRVSTLEDIVAEKLRALLQQPIRKRTRRQDLLDITVVLTKGPALDHAKVSRFLLAKSFLRDVPVTRAAFHHPDISTLRKTPIRRT
jgi:predicted nucleotidyltransferase component of viral defense system